MLLADILFYLFSITLLACALFVVGSKNTIYSVMFLIFGFFNAAGLFVLLNAEFLAMLLVIVYVGAIAVLFLFVVMMLNIDQKTNLKEGFDKYLPVAIFMSATLLIELLLIFKGSNSFTIIKKSLPISSNVSNVQAIGDVLYTQFIYPFQLSGIILLVAMIGAITLTLKEESFFKKKQNINQQNSRQKSQSIQLIKAATGKGIEI